MDTSCSPTRTLQGRLQTCCIRLVGLGVPREPTVVTSGVRCSVGRGETLETSGRHVKSRRRTPGHVLDEGARPARPAGLEGAAPGLAGLPGQAYGMPLATLQDLADELGARQVVASLRHCHPVQADSAVVDEPPGLAPR